MRVDSSAPARFSRKTAAATSGWLPAFSFMTWSVKFCKRRFCTRIMNGEAMGGTLKPVHLVVSDQELNRQQVAAIVGGQEWPSEW
ncbi:MAG: hypothetical protein QGF67_02720 [Lentisphaeria bacterium]|nr:hypothetical protein [Lentisphaeria bacterium]